MNFKKYQQLALRTLKELPEVMHYQHMAYGITGEMGEFIDCVKRSEIYGKPFDRVNLTEEYGDLLWFTGCTMHTAKFPAYVFDKYLEQLRREPIEVEDKGLRLVYLNQAIAQSTYDILICAKVNGSDVDLVTGPLVRNIIRVGLLYEIDFEHAMEVNISKLALRYGDKYSDFKALNRDVQAERQVLEGKK